jgi:hypothetical protein
MEISDFTLKKIRRLRINEKKLVVEHNVRFVLRYFRNFIKQHFEQYLGNKRFKL